jgi:hypothetical protein
MNTMTGPMRRAASEPSFSLAIGIRGQFVE